jgi:heptosyltransferase II
MAPAKRILVRGPNYLGDHVMALPFYDRLRKEWPEAHLTLLIKKKLSELKPLGFDEVMVMESGNFHFGRTHLAPRQFEWGITLAASLSSAAMLFGARIPKRVGFSEPLGLIFLNRGKLWKGVKSGQHKKDLYLQLLDLLEPGNGTGSKESPSFEGLSVGGSRERTIVLAPSASIRLREWPYFPELSAALLSELPEFSIVVVGDVAANGTRTFSSSSDRIEDLRGKTTLKELAHLCSTAKLVIANDSGVAHLAATVANVPTLVLFGPGDPNYIRPLGSDVTCLRIDIPCSPCESATCRAPIHKRCLNDLELGRVLETAVSKARE